MKAATQKAVVANARRCAKRVARLATHAPAVVILRESSSTTDCAPPKSTKYTKSHVPSASPLEHRFLKEVVKSANVAEWELEKTVSTGLILLQCDFQEEKRLGILFLKERSADLDRDHVDRIGEAIDADVYDWATCDTLCGVLRRVIEKDGALVECMVDWSDAPNLWRRRASCVSLLRFARDGTHADSIESICDRCVKMDKRFVQLGVGWLLREFSRYDRDRVVRFLRAHYRSISREGLRYALEKMPNALRKEIMDEHKEANAKGSP